MLNRESGTKFKVKKWPSYVTEPWERPESPSLTGITCSDDYQGLLFFGEGPQHHPSPRKLHTKSSQQASRKGESRENEFDTIFLDSVQKLEGEKKSIKSKFFRPSKPKRVRPCIDPYPHSCPGQRKAFYPECSAPFGDLGETSSIIVGETIKEIPVRRVRRSSSGAYEEEEIFLMSDLWEKRRIYLSHNERMAHGHFFKKFALVRVIGPKVTAAITTTQLPTKRKPIPDLQLLLESEAEQTLLFKERDKTLSVEKEEEEEAGKSDKEKEDEFIRKEEDLESRMEEEEYEAGEAEEEDLWSVNDKLSRFDFEQKADSDWQIRYEEAERKREEEKMKEENERREEQERIEEKKRAEETKREEEEAIKDEEITIQEEESEVNEEAEVEVEDKITEEDQITEKEEEIIEENLEGE